MLERLSMLNSSSSNSSSNGSNEVTNPPNRRRGRILLAVGAAVLIIAIAATIGGVLTRHGQHHRPDYQHPDIAFVISEESTFPNGSFSINFTSIRPGPPGMTPIQPNGTALAKLGIKINDQDYSLAEAGRISHFYVTLPRNAIVPGPAEDQGKGSPVKISSIGIRFGEVEHLTIVPLFLTETIGSGITNIKIKNPSIMVYEIRIRFPETLCLNEESGCHFTSWRIYACARDNETCASSESPSTLAIPCGDQCGYSSSSLCAMATCRPCGGQGTLGVDAPLSRRYNFGVTAGVFELQYDTGPTPNRVLVTYQGNIIYDSGCVSTVGNKALASVRFQGTMKDLRVDVEPNCKFGKIMHDWCFNVSCLFPCSHQGNVGVLIQSNWRQVLPGGRVPITKEAVMPEFTAYYCPGNEAQDDIRWSLKVNTTPGKPDRCPTQVQYGRGPNWNATLQMIQGGDAVLEWRVRNETIVGSMQFKIVGTNPDVDWVIEEIHNRTDLWYVRYVAQRESGHKQFGGDGYPLMGSHNGYGIFPMQNPLPTCTQVWSWKHNVKMGVIRLIQRAAFGKSIMAFWRNMARRQLGFETYVTERREAHCLFKDDTERTIEDAVALKAFDGNSTLEYCRWNETEKAWEFYPTNDMGINYVQSVCRLVPPN